MMAAPAGATAAPFTVDRAVQLALSRAPEIRAAAGRQQAASHQVRQAWSAYLPRVGANVSYMAWWPKNELPIELPNLPGIPEIQDIDDYHHVTAGLEAGIRVLDLARGPRVDAARQAESAAKAAVGEAECGLAFQVRATFLAALFSRDVKRIAEESLKLARAQEKQDRLRAEVGTGSQVALAQARVRLAQLEAQYRQAESELSRHRRQLASLVGLPESGLPSLEGDLEALARPLEPGDLGQNPQLVRLRASREAARLNATSVKRTFVPTVDLFAKADVEYPHRMKTEWGPLLQGGAMLKWPFYEGGLRWSRVREAEANSSALAARAQATRERLERKLIDLGARAGTADADLASAKETLRQTEIYLRVAKAAVVAGTGTDLDVHQAELGLDQARIAVRKALLALALVRAETLMVQGRNTPRPTGGES